MQILNLLLPYLLVGVTAMPMPGPNAASADGAEPLGHLKARDMSSDMPRGTWKRSTPTGPFEHIIKRNEGDDKLPLRPLRSPPSTSPRGSPLPTVAQMTYEQHRSEWEREQPKPGKGPDSDAPTPNRPVEEYLGGRGTNSAPRKIAH
ncbi:hypothetical protein PspLS_01641 [Pyricularia sp. CBS 133598]|nr:hypothetical protein PspLS_01641 [Pyricularia sp. CBS 133598]